MLERRLAPLLVAVVAVVSLAPPAVADVRVPHVFGDHMVLQRERPIVVWGTADPGERVTVRIARRSAQTRAGEDGSWRVELKALKAGGPHTLTVRGKSKRVFEDVLVGEVWICSGQSNMAWPVARSKDAEAEIRAANHPEIRLCTIPNRIAVAPQADVRATWAVCEPSSARGFSAVAYYFGRMLQSELGVPVGLVNTTWGGTPAEAWTPRTALKGPLADLVVHWQQREAVWDAEPKGKDPRDSPHRPANLWNAMVAPLVPMSVRGVIWYQGESNAGRAWQYRTLFPTLIGAWRTAWGVEDLPFYFVQLANFRPRQKTPGESAWAELRDAQLHTLHKVPHTGMAVTIDIGEASDIHPRNKQEVGRRLALWALARDYGKRLPCSGPSFASSEVDGAKAIVHFTHTQGGLALSEGASPKGFAVAGEDRVWHWAHARLEGDTVVLVCPDVPAPVAVRYAWADNPDANLVNAVGLPASPFRTDDWPFTTAPKR